MTLPSTDRQIPIPADPLHTGRSRVSRGKSRKKRVGHKNLKSNLTSGKSSPAKREMATYSVGAGVGAAVTLTHVVVQVCVRRMAKELDQASIITLQEQECVRHTAHIQYIKCDSVFCLCIKRWLENRKMVLVLISTWEFIVCSILILTNNKNRWDYLVPS